MENKMANPFGAFKTALCEHLTIETCRRLCTHFGILPATTESILESRPQGVALLDELENQGQLGPRDLQQLCDAFRHLRMDHLAKMVEDHKSSQDLAETSSLPDDLDSDDSLGVTENRPFNMTFEEFKTKCGLTETITLKKMMEINISERDATPAELLWKKITSLDYRITSPDMTQDLSVRDLIFAILHCSNNSLRQDIMSKMTSCQLAVPLVLNGINNGKPVFMYWAMRTIRKKIKGLKDNDPIDRPMYVHGTLTVSFLRIDDIRLSKSDLLNSLLSESQGNQAHSFYLSKKEDLAKPSFANGSIEAVWYIPEADGKGLLEGATTFLNLRGDAQKFEIQTEFLCKVSNLIFVLIGTKNWKMHKNTVENLKQKTAKVIVLAIKEVDDTTTEHTLDLRHESVIIVRRLNMKVLNNEICRRITKVQKSCLNLWSLEKSKDNVKDIIGVDISNEYLESVKGIVENIVPKQTDITVFKRKILRLNNFWLKWAALDEMTYTTDLAIEQQRASREEEKTSIRMHQVDTNISPEVKAFWYLLKFINAENDMFDDCLIYLQTLLFELTHEHQVCSKSAQKVLRNRLLDKPCHAQVGEYAQVDLQDIYFREINTQWQLSIGIEDFLRELGQLFEANLHCRRSDQNLAIEIMRLPALAAQFFAKGNTLEILDDKSYCLQAIWINSIFEELSELLGENAMVLVVSVIGVQGSGKSTLLNSMFGTKFPVSAGRCTRGLFLRLLKVEESVAKSCGCDYIIVVDTEGLTADHGGQDDASSRRLDNKMVTLAMCIADLIIVNIEGENIGSDMTNFLQIAAYALIRMKEVDLQSQCRIIQQRVSDPTASSTNRANMLKILSILDKAVKNVAEAEGFGDHYERFSDIFKLSIDDHTQYVCNLWSGNMNPPNPLYGKVVTKFKEQIFDSILKENLKIHFTIATFWGRLLAVHEALKEENFVLNFEDVSRAITYNEFSLQCNKWLGDARVKVMESWHNWQNQIRTSKNNDRETLCEKIRIQLSEEISKEDIFIQSHLKAYLETNDNTKNFHTDYFETWIKSSLLKIEDDIRIKILNEVKASKWASTDIPSFVKKTTNKVRLQAKEIARNSNNGNSAQLETEKLEEFFNTFWEKSIKDIVQTFQATILRPEDIDEKCTSILQNLCTENAFYGDIVRLLTIEGCIAKHREEFNIDDYIPKKNMKERFMGTIQQIATGRREQKAKDSKFLITKVKNSALRQFRANCCGKAFDSYLIQITLQKVLENLTMTGEAQTIKIPSSLLAKVLLHICSKISELATNSHKMHQMENSFEYLFDEVKNEVYLDFRSFFVHPSQDNRAFEYVCNLLVSQFSRFTLDMLRSNIVMYFIYRVVRTKHDLHLLILRHMFEGNQPFNYIEYFQDNVNFLTNWLRNEMTRMFTRNENGISWIQFQYELTLKEISALSFRSRHVTKLAGAKTINKWCETFTELCSNQFKIQFDLEEAHIYKVSDIPLFSERVLSFCISSLFGKTKERVQLPKFGDIQFCEKFLERTLNRPYDDVINNFLGCQEQCPFCKAPCREESTEGHKHMAFCHYPRGFAGKTWAATNTLVEEFCTSSVSSTNVSFEVNGEFFSYKDYAKQYPDWKIPTSNNTEQNYWKWVFSQHNDFFAGYYMCQPAVIPDEWQSNETKRRARNSFTSLFDPMRPFKIYFRAFSLNANYD